MSVAFGLSCLAVVLVARDAKAQASGAASSQAPSSDVEALRAELQAQREQLQTQQAELQAQRAELERQRQAIEASPRTDGDAPAAASDVARGTDTRDANAAADADVTDDAQLAALLEDAQAEIAPTVDESLLRLYGFADVGWQRVWGGDVALLLPSLENTFVLGNLNLYIDANPSPDWRMLAEVRFGLFPLDSDPRPRGSLDVGGRGPDTTVADPSASNGGYSTLRWAGVSLQRAHIDWTGSDYLNIRAGLFLTPYGVWNVDHGTPTRIMVSEPVFLAALMFPSQLLGVEAFGSVSFLPWTLGYHLHVSNGRMIGQVDPTEDKAIGGRLFLSTRFPVPFKVGISGYYGTSQEITRPSRAITIDFSELAFSADVSLDIDKLRFRAEMVANWTTYQDGKRRDILGHPVADSLRYGGYMVLAYELPWYGVEPYLSLEVVRIPVPRELPVGEGFYAPGGGINLYFTPSTMLRTQISITQGFDLSDQPVDTSRAYLYSIAARLVTAF